ncbi:uncharacterized protein K441DRAFT_371454 [Cenococcum geophilum 1.58]|uniref:uncharacterized protein n=1 Tax=Cenococcum geophilum 1.58 TaxID=794803 RepID=UPI00358FE713|nr:hypothetical protein K441DRAFT_371454 [Cenococcum geophilum 1.58]
MQGADSWLREITETPHHLISSQNHAITSYRHSSKAMDGFGRVNNSKSPELQKPQLVRRRCMTRAELLWFDIMALIEHYGRICKEPKPFSCSTTLCETSLRHSRRIPVKALRLPNIPQSRSSSPSHYKTRSKTRSGRRRSRNRGRKRSGIPFRPLLPNQKTAQESEKGKYAAQEKWEQKHGMKTKNTETIDRMVENREIYK